MKHFVVTLKEKLNNQPLYLIDFKSKSLMQIRYLLSTPFIYGMIIPMIVFHILIEIYHRITFILYGIEYVDYQQHFIFSRHKLSTISFIQKINCFYCEYGNGLASYIKEIIGKTETYWCPIKNGRVQEITHSNYKHFMEYQDTDKFEQLRDSLREKISYK